MNRTYFPNKRVRSIDVRAVNFDQARPCRIGIHGDEGYPWWSFTGVAASAKAPSVTTTFMFKLVEVTTGLSEMSVAICPSDSEPSAG